MVFFLYFCVLYKQIYVLFLLVFSIICVYHMCLSSVTIICIYHLYLSTQASLNYSLRMKFIHTHHKCDKEMPSIQTATIFKQLVGAMNFFTEGINEFLKGNLKTAGAEASMS